MCRWTKRLKGSIYKYMKHFALYELYLYTIHLTQHACRTEWLWKNTFLARTGINLRFHLELLFIRDILWALISSFLQQDRVMKSSKKPMKVDRFLHKTFTETVWFFNVRIFSTFFANWQPNLIKFFFFFLQRVGVTTWEEGGSHHWSWVDLPTQNKTHHLHRKTRIIKINQFEAQSASYVAFYMFNRRQKIRNLVSSVSQESENAEAWRIFLEKISLGL